MEQLARGTISGPEARGRVSVVAAPDGSRTLEITELWVAPGAPDVRLYVSPRADGTVDETAVELGPVADGEASQGWRFPADLSASTATTVVVYCHVYSVYFGHAALEWAS